MCCTRPFTLSLLLLATGVGLGLAISTLTSVTPTVAAEAKRAAAPAVEPVEESMHEFMEYVFEPGYKRLKVELAKPEKDRAVWKAVKGDALTLAEAANLLIDRAPEDDGAAWKQHAVAVRQVGGVLYKAAKAGDAAKADSAWREMLTNCNACHQQFAGGEHQLSP